MSSVLAGFSTTLATLGACILSACGLAWSASRDAKRRRIYRLPALRVRPRQRWLRRLLVLAPGFALLWMGDTASFTIWLGVLTLAGWCVALVGPRSVLSR